MDADDLSLHGREGLDDRLALLFVACDEAISPASRMVLALRVVCGLTIPEIAGHLGIQETAAAARLTRAKRALAEARGTFHVPEAIERERRLPVVIACVAGMFTVAHRTVLDPADALADTGRQALSIADALVAAYPATPRCAACAPSSASAWPGAPVASTTPGTGLALDEVDRTRWDGAAAAGRAGRRDARRRRRRPLRHRGRDRRAALERGRRSSAPTGRASPSSTVRSRTAGPPPRSGSPGSSPPPTRSSPTDGSTWTPVEAELASLESGRPGIRQP